MKKYESCMNPFRTMLPKKTLLSERGTRWFNRLMREQIRSMTPGPGSQPQEKEAQKKKRFGYVHRHPY